MAQRRKRGSEWRSDGGGGVGGHSGVRYKCGCGGVCGMEAALVRKEAGPGGRVGGGRAVDPRSEVVLVSNKRSRVAKTIGSQKTAMNFEEAGDDYDCGDEESSRPSRKVNLEVKQSLMDTAGLGLFNYGRGIVDKEWIAPFGGERIKQLVGKFFEKQIHAYIMEVGGIIVDCVTYECGYGRFMNDPFDEHMSNVKCELRDGVIWMRALKYIEPGAELLMSYGQSYWRVHMRFLSPCDREKCSNGYKM